MEQPEAASGDSSAVVLVSPEAMMKEESSHPELVPNDDKIDQEDNGTSPGVEPLQDSSVFATNESEEPPEPLLSPLAAIKPEEPAYEAFTPREQDEPKEYHEEEKKDMEMPPPVNNAEQVGVEAAAETQPLSKLDEHMGDTVEVELPIEEPTAETTIEKQSEEVVTTEEQVIQDVTEPPVTNDQALRSNDQDVQKPDEEVAEPLAATNYQEYKEDEPTPAVEDQRAGETELRFEEDREMAQEAAPEVGMEDDAFQQEVADDLKEEEDLVREQEEEREENNGREQEDDQEKEDEELERKDEHLHAPTRPLEGPMATYGSNPSEAYPYSIHWGPPPPPPFASPVRHSDSHKGGHDDPHAGMHQYPPPPHHGYPYYYGPPPGYPPSYPYYPPPPHVTPGYGYPPPPPPGHVGQLSHGASQQALLQQPLYSPVPHSPTRGSRHQPPPHSPYYYGAPPPYLPAFPDTKNTRGKDGLQKSPKSAEGKENETAQPSPLRRSSVGESQQGDTSVDTDSMMTDDEPVNIRTYIKPITTTNPDILQKRHRKNQQSRSRAQKHKDRVAKIMEKRPEDRTPDEQKEAELFENRRAKKNDRSRQRAIEKKEAIDKILTKPESQRTKLEIQFLEQALSAKKRKNEGDRMRRERLKMLGLQNRGDSNGNKKPKVSARGPLPPELAERVAANAAGSDLGPPPMQQHDYPPHGYYPPPPGAYGYPHPGAGYPPPAWDSYGHPPSGPGGPGIVVDSPDSPDRAKLQQLV